MLFISMVITRPPEELSYALENELLHIVADNLMEVELLEELSQRYSKKSLMSCFG